MNTLRLVRVFVLVFIASLFVTALQPSSSHAAGLDSFIINNYDVKMSLGKDKNNRSTLTTTENITVQFQPNQNHGIERQFVKSYDGHPTGFKLKSVTDQNGQTFPYHWSNDTLRIGDGDSYMSGQKTFIITYEQHDVTKFYADTNSDEFYWDIIGTQWRVPIERSSYTLVLDRSLVSSVKGDLQCYWGREGQSNLCATNRKYSDQFSAVTASLLPFEGVTVSLGFTPGTFAPYKQSVVEMIFGYWIILQAILFGVAILLTIWLAVRYRRMTGRKSELDPISPEYTPPKDTSVTTAASIGNTYGIVSGSVMAAQIVDFAVRHYIKIYETSKKSFLGIKSYDYEIAIIRNPSSLKAEERELLSDMFDHLPSVGERLDLNSLRNNRTYAIRTMDNDKKLSRLIENDYGLKAANPEHQAKLKHYAKVTLFYAVLLLSPPLLVVSLITYAISGGKSLTDSGLNLRRYLLGLRMYIDAAETDRLKMLQSVEGAEKPLISAKDAEDPQKLVVLYEKVLPYAILFGLEKSWSEQIGTYYEDYGSEPSWYVGASAFSAINLSSSLNALTVAAATTSSYSSSSGGSSGGGFSGGGGGGGGGGGW